MSSQYKPEMFVWELTMGCNLRCGHCGSACRDPLPDELTTEEALRFCDEVAELGVRWMSLSGGEPLLRKDWHLIAERLNGHGIAVCMVTNGTLIDEEAARRMSDCHMALVSISLDGAGALHDRIRGAGCYDKARSAYALLQKYGISCGANTTVTTENFDNLSELRDELIRMGVKRWQIQPGIPTGNMSRDKMLGVRELRRLIDFSLEENKKGKLSVLLAETVGYYTANEIHSRRLGMNSDSLPVWLGCNAGIRSFGILHNGDVNGCTSIRSPEFVEGNIRERPIADIWNDEKAFAWRRNLRAGDLSGFCKTCEYGEYCLGGCSNVKLVLNGGVSCENPLCVYRDACLSRSGGLSADAV